MAKQLTPYALVARTLQVDYHEEDHGDQRRSLDTLLASDHRTEPGLAAKEVPGFGTAPSPQDRARQVSPLMICPALFVCMRAKEEKEAKLRRPSRTSREKQESESKKNNDKNDDKEQAE